LTLPADRAKHAPMSVSSPSHPSTLRTVFQGLPAAAFLLTAVLLLPVGPDSGPYRTLSIMFASIVLEALPFMLIGAFVGGLIEAFVSRERMAGLLPRRPLAAICMAAGLGLIFPVCECAVVPVVRRLLGKGLPFSAGLAYLLAGPIVNPIVGLSTALAYNFDWEIVALRLGLGYLIAVTIAVIMDRLFPGKTALSPGLENVTTSSCLCGCEPTALLKPFSQVTDAVTTPTVGAKLQQALRHGAADFLGVGQYLIIGAFVAAAAQTFVDRSLLLELAALPVVSIVAMTLLAVALNLCSEADAFIAASFMGIVPRPAQMAFMLTGPMFDLKLLLMYQLIFRQRPIIILSILILVLTVSAPIFLWLGGMA